MRPVCIVGDIHGQFYDLRDILKYGGDFESNKYLFMGDYVDRGNYGVEVLFSLLVLKIAKPNTIFLMRGNHESAQMTQLNNFYNEILIKYD